MKGQDGGKDAVRTYLNGATRGLRSRQRQEVASELIGHIEARIQEFKLAGFSDAEAMQQTLRELGAPDYVHSGMQRVYVWPSVFRTTGMLSALACAAIFGALQLSSVLAQVQGYKPSFTPLPGPYTYVETQSLRDELQKAGATVTGDLTQPTLTLPGFSKPIYVNTTQDDVPNFVSRSIVRDYVTGRSFLDLNAVVSAVTQAGQNAYVEGWLNPKLHLGQVTLTLGTADQPMEAYNLYNVVLNPLAKQLGLVQARSSRTDDLNVFSYHQLAAPSTNQPSTDEVYALVSVKRLSRIWGRDPAPVLYFDLARANAQGQLNFQMPYELAALQLTSDPAQLQTDAEWLRANRPVNNYASTEHPAHAMLLKLSGNLSHDTYQVVAQNTLSLGDQR